MLCLFVLSVGSVAGGADADWLTYNRTLAGDRFSPLKDIDRSNVAQMMAICTYSLPEVSSLQTGPLVVDGAMYFTTDEGSYAIDAGTCAEKWKTASAQRHAKHVAGEPWLRLHERPVVSRHLGLARACDGPG
jgi:glucose dehydrogenase